MNFAQLIRDACRQRPSNPAVEMIRTDGSLETISFGELDDLAERAARWLVQGGRSITTIGLELGYSDSANFSRAFRKAFLVSPSEYQRGAGCEQRAR